MHDIFTKHSDNPEATMYILTQTKKRVSEDSLLATAAIAHHHAQDKCLRENICNQIEDEHYQQTCNEGLLNPFQY